MPKGKIQQILQEKSTNKIYLENSWKNFLKKGTYLTFDEKQQFIETLKNLAKIPRISWFYFKTRKKLKEIKGALTVLNENIINYNQNFIKKRLEEYSSFFDGKDDNLKFGLDEDQRVAVVKDEKHNLVVAGAGSGKTSVITSRIAYLIRRKDKIEPEKILALAFTRNAAKEMEERIRKNYGLNVSISTFHSLGWNLIKEETNKKPNLLFDGNENDQYLLIKDIFKNLLKEKEYQDILIQYLAYHPEQEVKEENFERKVEYYKYMRKKKYTTLNNIEVKSIGERDVGNFLFLHNIEFKYEPLVEWVDRDEQDKEYHPDFYLPEYDIYIEHWGLNEKCKVAPWFTITTQEYLELRKWKLDNIKKVIKKINYIAMMPSLYYYNHIEPWGTKICDKLNKEDISSFISIAENKRFELQSYKRKNPWQRAKSVEGAFIVDSENENLPILHDRSCLILDDVCTTGSHINELTNTLVEAGIKDTYAFVIGKTKPDFILL